MKACSEFKELLVLDAHGALAAEERSAWERHCADCAACRQERERLCALIRTASEALRSPGLSPHEEQALAGSVQRALRPVAPEVRPRRTGWVLAPAFAACMVLIVAGWFGVKNFGSPDAVPVSAHRVQEDITFTDTELLENMELLQEMESLERLVNLLDKQKQETSLLERGSNADRIRENV